MVNVYNKYAVFCFILTVYILVIINVAWKLCAKFHPYHKWRGPQNLARSQAVFRTVDNTATQHDYSDCC